MNKKELLNLLQGARKDLKKVHTFFLKNKLFVFVTIFFLVAYVLYATILCTILSNFILDPSTLNSGGMAGVAILFTIVLIGIIMSIAWLVDLVTNRYLKKKYYWFTIYVFVSLTVLFATFLFAVPIIYQKEKINLGPFYLVDSHDNITLYHTLTCSPKHGLFFVQNSEIECMLYVTNESEEITNNYSLTFKLYDADNWTRFVKVNFVRLNSTEFYGSISGPIDGEYWFTPVLEVNNTRMASAYSDSSRVSIVVLNDVQATTKIISEKGAIIIAIFAFILVALSSAIKNIRDLCDSK